MGISASLGSSALLPAGLGFRNTLANGGFSVDQRNSGAAQTITAAAALAYTTDRWYAYCTGANVTSQRIAGSAPFQYNHQFTGATSNTLIGFGQRIEAANSFNYAGNTATLSAYIKSSSLTSVTWTLYYATTTDTFGTVASPTRTQIATGTFTISSVLTRFSTQISVPAAATTGLELVFTTGALVASQTLVFAGVQLEQNLQATPFEQRPIGVELALCQRYYQQFTSTVGDNSFCTGVLYLSTLFLGALSWSPMRAAPIVAFSGSFNLVAAGLANSCTPGSGNITATSCQISGTVTGYTAGNGGTMRMASGAFYSLNAEL
jgi:hypothetical protein